MTFEEYNKSVQDKHNKQAVSDGRFTGSFERRSAVQRHKMAQRKQRVRLLLKDGITSIDVLAQHFMISVSTMRGVIYQMGLRIENSRVIV
ncbi:hypothetical protein ACNOHF_01625 [Leuconostoc mesenteroides]|uniref:hypothetical protein n=1 Tax=Leuconostoc mesenteroides TaxID=1245 RepID=UPI001239C68E|nr:hypothetical protein [Leuconostoc mesenteroides]KAA8346594.1 hypothetical protein FE418_09630 [Leuconostoc mesenteroides]